MDQPPFVPTPTILDLVAKFVASTTPVVAASCADNRTGGCIFICDKTGEKYLHKMVGTPTISIGIGSRTSASRKCWSWSKAWPLPDYNEAAVPPRAGGFLVL
jgi:hypothetical protein